MDHNRQSVNDSIKVELAQIINQNRGITLITKEQLEDYLFTLDVCKTELPPDTHPEHFKRLRTIAAILKSLSKEV